MTKLFRILILGLLLWSVPASAQHTAPKPEKVHNVILMIGDGMGLGQVAAYMIENQYGPTAFDRAHYTAVCKTYSANNRVTDSGAAATAMATGHKTKNSRIGVTPDGAPAQSITELAKAKGLATGIVVTSHLADATPAGFMAHTPDRHNTSEIAAAYETSGIDVARGRRPPLFRKAGGRAGRAGDVAGQRLRLRLDPRRVLRDRQHARHRTFRRTSTWSRRQNAAKIISNARPNTRFRCSRATGKGSSQ